MYEIVESPELVSESIALRLLVFFKVGSILYPIYYILYTIYYILYTIYYVLNTIHYTLYIIHYILYSIPLTSHVGYEGRVGKGSVNKACGGVDGVYKVVNLLRV